ncbi:MAG: ATP-dependent sacrificial sulfur transferase LarE [Nitrospirae bacterium]|nr:ATP-dependent sacrificial sulfur transferase LarE [Nitrospirota bacterium]
MVNRLTDSNNFERLIAILKKLDNVILAYSGGVDSTLLLKALQLAGIKSLAVTAVSETMPEEDFLCAKRMVEEIGMEHRIINTAELEKEDFAKNPPDRCFYCKDELFGRLQEIADKEGYNFILDGSNLDDIDDWRPGRKAALKYGVRSPLIEAGLNKDEIRRLSSNLNLSTWDRPSSPCLASRFPYGERITGDALKQVADAEKFLRSLGFIGFRVRHHRDVARIELEENEIRKLLARNIKAAVVKKLKSFGYKFITVDLEGFRSGRMNDGLNKELGEERTLS